MAKHKPKQEEAEVDPVKLAAQHFFKAHKDNIYNFIESEDFIVSTGSYALDDALGGGFGGGKIIRHIGFPGCGKSSQGLLMIKNFLEQRPKSRGLIVPTEARLTTKIRSRSGVKFVYSPDEWENGTCLVLEMNVYEDIAKFLMSLVNTNQMRKPEDRENFIVMIDCLDYLVLAGDLDKEISDNYKVAGTQYLTKKLWARLAMPFQKGGHVAIFTSQVSAAPKIDPRSKDPVRQGQSSGGFAVQHSADLVLDFTNRYGGDYILENSSDPKYDEQKNKKVGHTVTVWIRKSDNEKYDVKVEYPIKYGRENGNSIWLEREIGDWCMAYSLLYKEGKGAWLNLQADLLKEINAITPTPEKFQGINNFYQFLEDNPKVTQFLQNKLKTTLIQPVKNESGEDPLA